MIDEKVNTDKEQSLKLDKSKWKLFRFDQIAINITERVEPKNTDLEIYVGLEHIDPESIHIKRFGKREDVEGTKLRVYPGDVIFGRRRAYQRKAAIAEFDGFCSAHAMVLRANEAVIDKKLFPFFLHSDAFMHRAIDISVGSLSPTINWGTLKEQEFLLPPKDQQAKIAELLWAGDELLEQTFKSKKALDDFTRSYENQSFLKFGKIRNDDLPIGYTIKEISDLAYIYGGSTPSRIQSEYWSGDIPWLTPTDVTNHDGIDIYDTKEHITDQGLKSSSLRLLPPDSILLCTRASIGAAVINKVSMTTNQGFTNLVCKEGISPYFLYFLLRSLTPDIMRLAGGSTFLEVSKSSIRRLKVILPDHAKMKIIEEQLLQLYNLSEIFKFKIDHLKKLNLSIINQIL